jgi:hypothetical protein
MTDEEFEKLLADHIKAEEPIIRAIQEAMIDDLDFGDAFEFEFSDTALHHFTMPEQ